MIASFLKIPFIDKEVANNSYPRKMGHIDGLKPHNSRKDTALDWTDVYEKEPSSSSALESSENKSTTSEGLSQHEGADTEELGSGNHKYKKVIYGEEALKISPQRPYPCPCRRRIGGMSKPLTGVLTVSNSCQGRIRGVSEC